jgi:acyl carrier protein
MENRIRNIMSEVFKIPADSVNDKSSPDTIESWDSLKHLQLILSLEDEFEIIFNDDEIAAILSFDSIRSIINEKLNKKI